MKKLLIALALLGLTACGARYEVDQTLRVELFRQCLGSVPEGPQVTRYNDWEEVVTACDSISLSQAKTCVENCDSNVANDATPLRYVRPAVAPR